MLEKTQLANCQDDTLQMALVSLKTSHEAASYSNVHLYYTTHGPAGAVSASLPEPSYGLAAARCWEKRDLCQMASKVH